MYMQVGSADQDRRTFKTIESSQATVAGPGILEPWARSRRVNFFRSGNCFDAPSHIPYAL